MLPTKSQNSVPAIRKPSGAVMLPENAQWTNRMEIKSESSNRLYIIAQNKASGLWACSCPGWIAHRKCKHLLKGCGLQESQIHGRMAKLGRTEEKKGLGK